MNIALVVPGGVDGSGEYRVIPGLLALIKRLAREHSVRVFALRQWEKAGRWQLLGAQVQNIGRPMTVPRAVAAIAGEHRSHPFDVIHSIWSGPCGLVAVTAARLLGVSSVVHVAGGELVALPDIQYGGSRRFANRIRERFVLRAANAVSAASTPMLDRLAKLGINASRLCLGVDLEVWPPRQPQRRGRDEPFRIVHIGSLNRVKDQGLLLRAAAQIARVQSNFTVDFVGEDTLQGKLQDLARSLGVVDKVSFHGFMRHSDLYLSLLSKHVHVVSSRHEAGPIAMLEAAAAGVPTVGTAVGHVAEWAPRAALASAPADVAALARNIAKLMCDEDLRLAIAQQAYARAIAEDADSTFTAVEHLYSRVQRDR